jgi:hypothetical protein
MAVRADRDPDTGLHPVRGRSVVSSRTPPRPRPRATERPRRAARTRISQPRRLLRPARQHPGSTPVLGRGEYRDSLRTAELAYIRQLVNDIDNDDLEGIDWWHQIHNGPGRQQRDALLGDPHSRGGSSDSAATVAAEQERPVVSAGEISIRCRRARLRLRRVGANLRNDSPRVFLYISHPGALPAKT